MANYTKKKLKKLKFESSKNSRENNEAFWNQRQGAF